MTQDSEIAAVLRREAEQLLRELWISDYEAPRLEMLEAFARRQRAHSDKLLADTRKLVTTLNKYLDRCTLYGPADQFRATLWQLNRLLSTPARAAAEGTET